MCLWQGFVCGAPAGVAFVNTGQSHSKLAPDSSTTDPPKDIAKLISQGGGTSVKPYLKGPKVPDGEMRSTK